MIFFGFNSIVQYKFFPQGQLIKSTSYEFYAVWMDKTNFVIKNSWQRHYDNALVQMSLLVREFLIENITVMMPQPTFLPDMNMLNFFSFKTDKKLETQSFCDHRFY